MKEILISGGSGNVGTPLSAKLLSKGYKVKHLSREKSKKDQNNVPTYLWDLEKSLVDEQALENTEAIIHLAGASITEKKWDESQKHKILDSRVEGTRLLFEKVSKLSTKPKVFICASGTGYYGNQIGSKAFEENEAPGGDFLANVCKEWEAEADKFETLGIRTIKLRTPVVLTSQGYALEEIKKVIKAYMGAPLGSGNQYLPWIHIEDLVDLYAEALENESFQGAYNAVAPQQVTNREFMETFAKVLDRPTLPFNMPSSLLKLSFGQMIEVLLGGSPISSKKLAEAGFKFKHSDLKEALENIWAKA